MTERSVDLSSDVGERPGRAGLADDFALLRIVTSANVACGGHAGDRVSMRTICEVAVAQGVAVGAQVSYVDWEGFGRRRLDVPRATLAEQLRDQWGELADAARAAGGHVAYMRPHGALYNAALVDVDVAGAVLDATPAGTPVLCLAGSVLAALADERGHPVAAEIFADRAVTDDGLLVPRGVPGAVIDDPEHVADRLAAWLRTGHLTSHSGRSVAVAARSICVHSDTPGAVRAAAKVRAALLAAGARLSPFVPVPTNTSTPGQAETRGRHHLRVAADQVIFRRIAVHQYGERALLVDVDGITAPDLADVARGIFGPDLINAVPADGCLLLTFAGLTTAERVHALLHTADAGRGPGGVTPPESSAAHPDPPIGSRESATSPTRTRSAHGAVGAPAVLTIDVRYDGEDLADVARRIGATPDEVIALHSGADYRVGFFGFAPGFGYLIGLPGTLHLPRRDTPRTAVPAGSVAIAAEYTAIYPRRSPGGWHILGHTGAVMFDPDRTPPTLLTPGARVRFRPA